MNLKNAIIKHEELFIEFAVLRTRGENNDENKMTRKVNLILHSEA